MILSHNLYQLTELPTLHTCEPTNNDKENNICPCCIQQNYNPNNQNKNYILVICIYCINRIYF